MTDYEQPEFYRFNEDSLKLVNWILQKFPEVDSILDLGSGCGVIGIELSNKLKNSKLTLVEVQSEYLPSLNVNIKNHLRSNCNAQVIITSFSAWIPDAKYDLIAINPPYYLPGHGQRNLDPRKEIARSFVKDDWSILLKKISESLSIKGHAYIVVKNDLKVLEKIEENASDLFILKETVGNLVFLDLSRLNKN